MSKEMENRNNTPLWERILRGSAYLAWALVNLNIIIWSGKGLVYIFTEKGFIDGLGLFTWGLCLFTVILVLDIMILYGIAYFFGNDNITSKLGRIFGDE